MTPAARVFVAGSTTVVGAALLESLRLHDCQHILGDGPFEPELTDAAEVDAFFHRTRPEYVFLVGGKSGGIGLNRERPAGLMLENLRTIANVLDAAHRYSVKKLLYLASACAYPRDAAQPLRVESLLCGPVEQTSEPYAVAKLAGWKLCEAYRRQYGCRFITGFPANVFGPHDDFSAESGHVIPALIRRMHDAKRDAGRAVSIWGTGKPRREFIFSRDLAEACTFVMNSYDGEAPINLGGGTSLTIAAAARTIADVVDFRGRLAFDGSMPDGAPLKALDSSTLFELGWRPTASFRAAVAETYRWFLEHAERPRRESNGGSGRRRSPAFPVATEGTAHARAPL